MYVYLSNSLDFELADVLVYIVVVPQLSFKLHSNIIDSVQFINIQRKLHRQYINL